MAKVEYHDAICLRYQSKGQDMHKIFSSLNFFYSSLEGWVDYY